MTASVNKTPVSIDYTNRDFYSVRQDLITRIQANTTWKGTDAADFGLVLVEAFSYLADTTAYYIDRAANENYLLTATQRSSIVNIAQNYGYNPHGYIAATASITFHNTGSTSITVPAGTEVKGTLSEGDTVSVVYFTTSTDAVMAAGTSVSVSATHGQSTALSNPPAGTGDVAGVLLGAGNGTPSQVLILKEVQVVDNSVSIFVQNGGFYGQWTQVLHLVDSGPNDPVYTVTVDDNGFTNITFGDGVSGAIPNYHSNIKAQYIVGGGVQGNVPSNTLTTFNAVGSNTLGITVDQLKAASLTIVQSASATGGQDPESIDSIRKNAPLSFTALNRAVTLDDYANLALQASSVGKAIAVSAFGTSVTLYVAPSGVNSATDPYPLYDVTNTTLSPATRWTSLQADVTAKLANKVQIGVAVTVSPPVYVPITVDVQYTLDPQYTAAQVSSDISSLLLAYYSYAYVSFGQVIHPEELEALLRYTPGVLNVKVINLYRTGNTAGRTVLVAGNAELFILQANAITPSAAHTDSTLSALSFPSNGTPTPTFSATSLNYNLSISAFSVTGVTRTSPSAVATVTTGTAHGFIAGNVVSISNLTNSDAEFNGTWTLLSGSGTTFTFTSSATTTVNTPTNLTGLLTKPFTISGAISDASATVQINNNAVVTAPTTGIFTASPVALPTSVLTSTYGIPITVVAQDGTTATTYSVNISKA